MSSAQPFHFQAHRLPVDWEVLKQVDVDHVMQRTDIDSLERVVHILAHGDFDAQLSAYGIEGCRRVLRLCQLAVEYLLYVQGQLADETSLLKSRGANNAGEVEALRARIRELKARLAVTQQELKRYRKTTKTYEFLASAGQAMLDNPTPMAALPAPGAHPGSPGGGHGAPGAPLSPQQMAADLAAFREENESLEKQLERAKRDAQEAQNKAAQSTTTQRQELEAAKGTVRRLQAQLDRQEAANRSHQSASRELGSVQASWRESMAKQRELEKGKDTLELELLSMRQHLEELTRPLAASRKLQDELQAAHRKVADLQKALQQQQRRITAVVGEGNGAQVAAMQAEAAAEADTLKRQVVALQEQLRVVQQSANANAPGASGSRDWRNDEIEKLQSELQKLQQEHRKVLLEQVAAKQQGTSATQDVARLQTRLAELDNRSPQGSLTNTNTLQSSTNSSATGYASSTSASASAPSGGSAGQGGPQGGPQGPSQGAAVNSSLGQMQGPVQQPGSPQQLKQQNSQQQGAPGASQSVQGPPGFPQGSQMQQQVSGGGAWSPVGAAEEPKKKTSLLAKITQGFGWKSKAKPNELPSVQPSGVAMSYPTGQVLPNLQSMQMGQKSSQNSQSSTQSMGQNAQQMGQNNSQIIGQNMGQFTGQTAGQTAGQTSGAMSAQTGPGYLQGPLQGPTQVPMQGSTQDSQWTTVQSNPLAATVTQNAVQGMNQSQNHNFGSQNQNVGQTQLLSQSLVPSQTPTQAGSQPPSNYSSTMPTMPMHQMGNGTGNVQPTQQMGMQMNANANTTMLAPLQITPQQGPVNSLSTANAAPNNTTTSNMFPTKPDDFTIKADWGSIPPASSVMMPQSPANNMFNGNGDVTLGPPKDRLPSLGTELPGIGSSMVASDAVTQAASKPPMDPLFSGFDNMTNKNTSGAATGAPGGPSEGPERPPEARQLKPVRSIIKQSSFNDNTRGLMKSPSGRRVMFNLPEGDTGKSSDVDETKASNSDANVKLDTLKVDDGVKYDDDGFPITTASQ